MHFSNFNIYFYILVFISGWTSSMDWYCQDCTIQGVGSLWPWLVLCPSWYISSLHSFSYVLLYIIIWYLSVWFCVCVYVSFYKLPLSCSLHGKEDLLEGGSWCWCFQKDLWWKQEEWKPSTPFLREQWCYCSTHPTTIAEHEHHWHWSQGVGPNFPHDLLLSHN